MRPASSVSSEKKFNQEIMNKRPKSAIVKFPLINNSKIRIKSKENHKDENKEKVKLIPYKIGKEQLYEDTVHLKIAVNKLRSQLDEAKSTIVQKDLEIKQKNKIIEDCTRDNDVEVVHKENIEKGKESTLISSCKKKYYEMKKLYRKKCEENDILKAHIKITKIKELEKENNKLQNDLRKMKNLYLDLQEEIEGGNKQINDLNDYKNKFVEQHILLSSIQSSCKQLNKDNSQLKSQLNQIGNEKEKKQKETKKLRTLNMKLKFTNGKLLLEKKQREQAEMKSNDYEDKKRKLNEKLSLLVNDYKNKGEEIRKLNNLIITGGKKEDMKVSKTIKQSEIIIGENEKEEKKNELIKSLLKDAQFKVNIYEKYLNEKNYNISRILRKYNYNNGLMNSHSIPLNINSNPKPPSPKRTKTKNNFEDRNKNVENEILQNINVNNDENQYLEEKEIQKYRPISKEEKKIDEEDKLNDLSETLLNEIQNALPQIMRINLEAKKITKDKLEEQIKIILDNFEKMGGEISKDDFIEPFRQLLIENMKITKENDVQLISSFLENLLDQFENNIDQFMDYLNNIFSNIYEFSDNENEKMDKLKFEIDKYPSLLNKIKEKDTNNNYIISYLDYWNISSEIKVNLEDELNEFLLYNMKKNVPENYSIFDLNYKIIEELNQENFNIIEENVDIETDSNEKINSEKKITDSHNENNNEKDNNDGGIEVHNENNNEIDNNDGGIEVHNENNNEIDNNDGGIEVHNENNNDIDNNDGGIEVHNENESEKFEIIENDKNISGFEKDEEYKEEINDYNLNDYMEDYIRVNNILKTFKEKIKNNNENLENIFIINEYVEDGEEKIEAIQKDEFIKILKDNEIQLENDDEEKIYSELKLDDKFNKPDFLNLSLIKKKLENEEL